MHKENSISQKVKIIGFQSLWNQGNKTRNNNKRMAAKCQSTQKCRCNTLNNLGMQEKIKFKIKNAE